MFPIEFIKKATPAKLYVRLFSLQSSRKYGSCGARHVVHPPAILNSPKRMRIGDDVSIGCHSYLNCIDNRKSAFALTIGDRCNLGRFLHINAYENVVIEDDVLIAERVHISDCSHLYSDGDVPIKDQGAAFIAPVRIRKGAWIGSGAVILPGVTVGRNAVVGANAVVSVDVPDNHVARGVPAKIFPKSTA